MCMSIIVEGHYSNYLNTADSGTFNINRDRPPLTNQLLQYLENDDNNQKD